MCNCLWASFSIVTTENTTSLLADFYTGYVEDSNKQHQHFVSDSWSSSEVSSRVIPQKTCLFDTHKEYFQREQPRFLLEESKRGSPFQLLAKCAPQIHTGLYQLLHNTMSFFNSHPTRSVCTFTYAVAHYLSALWLMHLFNSSTLPLAQINFCLFHLQFINILHILSPSFLLIPFYYYCLLLRFNKIPAVFPRK